MPSQPESEKTPASVPQARQAAPIGLPALTNEQRNLLEAYKRGQLDDEKFQKCLADDPVLSDYVRKVYRPTDPSRWPD